MLKRIEELCAIDGVPGREEAVAEYIYRQIAPVCERCEIDPLGNVLALKKGRNTPARRILLDAHMDEVGFIVTYITEEGRLRFSPLGGIDPRVVAGKPVFVGPRRAYGIIGTKAVHMMTAEERDKAPKIDELTIDIGAASREEAEKWVSPGDPVVFDSDFVCFGDGFIKAKALDDRAGCAVLMDIILKEELPCDTWFSFTVQEEIGGSGAKAAAYTVDPAIAISVETTTAADIAGVEEDKKVCFLGRGPVISFMDRGTIYDQELYRLALDTAEKHGIPAQPKLGVFGGNNAASLHKARGGVRPMAVSMPCRYLHTPSCVLKTEDIFATRELLFRLIGELGAL